MDKQKILLRLFIIVTLIGSVLLGHWAYDFVSGYFMKQKQINVSDQYWEDAAKINDFYYRFNVPTRVTVIKDALIAINRYLPNYFPEGPFTKKDLLAIIMVESSFNQYLTGRHKEYGLYQILPESSDWAGVKRNQFDINVNTELALFVLQKKFQEHKDYKMSIIAYNGVVKSKGKINETYWEKFIKYRKALDDILR